jgi:predicted phage baseplate assembly protein
VFRLAHAPILPDSDRHRMILELEEAGQWTPWRQVDDFFASDRESRHYQLDPEAGIIRFGDGVRGRIPQWGERIRVRGYRYGGGATGNVLAGAVSKIEVAGVKVTNYLEARGGADREGIEAALKRIPGELRRRDRAVTAGDFQELARMTPGVVIGRAECLPRFHPSTRSSAAAGVVSVMVWPQNDARHPNAPLPDLPTLQAVCRWLDSRRLVTTELYVIPPTYRQVAVSVALKVKAGYGIEAVRSWVELVLRRYLAPLPPYGPSGEGWPLGRRVYGPELEAAALQVEGVEYLEDLAVAGWDEAQQKWANGAVELQAHEVPELTAIVVADGLPLPEPGAGITPVMPDGVVLPIPVLREEC